jgi:uracil-DNA glycosylase family 4
MKYLPLYPERPRLHVEVGDGLDVNAACTRCELHKGAKHPCLPAEMVEPTAPHEGTRRRILVVADAPTGFEDSYNRPMMSEAGKMVRQILAKEAPDAQVVVAHAIRCPIGKGKLKDEHLDACKPYLTALLREVMPRRVLAFGPAAIRQVFGRSIPALQVRRAWQHSFNNDNPLMNYTAHAFLNPAMATRNRFLKHQLASDITHALLSRPVLGPESLTDSYILVEREQDLQSYGAMTFDGFYDVETAGVMHTPSFRIVSFAFKQQGASQVTVVCDEEALRNLNVRGRLMQWLTGPGRKMGHNIKYDALAVEAAWGCRVNNVSSDTRLMRKFLEPGSPGSLDTLAEIVGLGGAKDEMEDELERVVKETRRKLRAGEPLGVDAQLEAVIRNNAWEKEKWSYALVNPEIRARYVARDVIVSEALYNHQHPTIVAHPGHELYRDVVHPVAGALARVESWGIKVDVEQVHVVDKFLASREESAKNTLDSYYPEVNWNSAPQIRKVLTELGFKVTKLTDSGEMSTDKEVLTELSKKHEVPRALLEYRQMGKLRGTYTAGMLHFVAADGRIHPNILPDGTATGRMSCNDPNLQNVPVRPAEGKMIRDCFVAEDGYVLIQFDYSQIELRVVAMLSDDPVMKDIYNQGLDFHQKTAELISKVAWGIPPEQVTKLHRTMAKTVNFGILYGKTASAFAREFKISKQEAQDIIDAIMGQFKVLAKWRKEQLQISRFTGETWTKWNGGQGRCRSLWQIGDANDEMRSTAENGAVNTPVQGSAAEYLTKSLVECVNWIEYDRVPAKLLVPVHDSLLFEVKANAVDEVIGGVREIMEGYPTSVKLVTDVELGASWGSLTKWSAKEA